VAGGEPRCSAARVSQTLDRLLFPRRGDDADPPPGWFKHPPL
jgi:hypothetical protein